MHGSEHGVQLESVSVHGGSHVSRSHSKPRSVVSARENFDTLEVEDHDDRASHVSHRSRRFGLAPSDAGSHRSRSERRYSVAAPPLISHTTAPTIVVSEAHHSHHAPSVAPSHRSSRSKSQVSETRTVRIQEPDALSTEHSHIARSESGRSHRSSHSSRSRSHSRHRSHGSSAISDAGSRLTHENLATLSRPASPERTPSHAPSRAKSHHTSHSRSGSHAGTIRLRKEEIVEERVIEDAASHAPSRARSHHTAHSRAPSAHGDALQVIDTSREVVHETGSQVSHHSSRSRSHSHAGTVRPEGHQVTKTYSIVQSHVPSGAASHHSAHRSHVSAHDDDAQSESDNDSIYPESSISQRSERSIHSHAPSHYSHHSHHSRHSRHLTASHAGSHHSHHSQHSVHAPSHAPSHHTSRSVHEEITAASVAPSHRSSHSIHEVERAVSVAASRHSSHAMHEAEKAASVAGSHHSSHSHHSNVSGASTLKGSHHDHKSPDRQSHASSRTVKSSHSHHKHHSKVEAPEPPPAVKIQVTEHVSHVNHDTDHSSDDASPDEHGGSVALLHKRQKYKREVNRGRAQALVPLDERPECCGEGFRPHRSRSRRHRSHSHSGHKLEKGIVEVSENRLILAPTAKEIRRERERERRDDWLLPSELKVVATKKEAHGAKLYMIR